MAKSPDPVITTSLQHVCEPPSMKQFQMPPDLGSSPLSCVILGKYLASLCLIFLTCERGLSHHTGLLGGFSEAMEGKAGI